MKKILYIVSNLRRTGPTNQLYNLIKHLDRNVFEPHLITLSPEPESSRWQDYAELGVNLHSLGISRIQGVFFAKSKLSTLVKQIQPDLIHSQGIRADVFASNFDSIITICSVRNYPQKDYLMAYGKFLGRLVELIHIRALRKINLCVGVSRSVEKNLRDKYLIDDTASIQNGVNTEGFYQISNLLKNKKREELNLPKNSTLWVVSGRLSFRKDPLFLINQWNTIFDKNNNNILLFIGGGELYEECKRAIGDAKNIIFQGNVSNVSDYLQASDYVISSSKAEGLPNSIIEALSCGLPCLLSDIEPHAEIVSMNEKIGKLFELGNSSSFSENITAIQKQDYASMREAALDLISTRLSAEVMSKKYQDAYLELMNK